MKTKKYEEGNIAIGGEGGNKGADKVSPTTLCFREWNMR